MKKILSIILGFFCLLALSSCLKDQGYENQQYGLKEGGILDEPFVQILGGGLAKFGNQLIKPDASDPLNTADTVTFKIFYVNNGNVAGKDVKVTVAINNAAIATYNADPTQPDFDRLPDSTFRLVNTIVTVKAGQSFSDDIVFIYNPQKIDPSKLYMLPISIVDAQGVKISSNNSTTFLHIVGNPQAGTYTNTGIRYNYNCCTSVAYTYPIIPPGFSSTLTLPNPKVSTAVDGTTVKIDFANLGGADYAYLATVPSGLSGNTDFPVSLTFTAAFLAGNANIDIKAATYNPSTKTFHFNVAYLNNITNSNGFRIVDEVLVKQ